MKYLHPDIALGPVVPNIALMLSRNASRFADRMVYQEKRNGAYEGISWRQFFEDIQNIAYNLGNYGLKKGGKVIVFSPNRLEMLEAELAIMAAGGISVPIFAYFHTEMATNLIRHSGARLVLAASHTQLHHLDPDLELEKVFVFDDIAALSNNLPSFSELLNPRPESYSLDYMADEDDVCLCMYTSGTMGIPKCVQLTHGNILSQQAALSKVWNIDENDRFLSYLPWHHSFGGIFERFSALYNGATLSLESGYGKEPEVIMENWKLVKPTVFFSVPKVYQALIQLTKSNKRAEELFFHSGLKFVFTAAAPLPKKLSDEFESRGISVLEGWGLTETSPCCTLTDPKLKREPGVVGKPIPGVDIRIADDGEIQVKGPNVMLGYYKNDEANAKVFTDDGWFCTGDIGEITENGLKLISRKDRVFKLVNGEKVIPSDVEGAIHSKCHYIQFAMVVGSGKDYPVALLFPNRKMIDQPTYELSPEEGCFCPRNLEELSRCLRGCLSDANCCIGEKFSRIRSAMLIDDELSIENNTLTPSMKIIPNKLLNIYSTHLERLYGAENELPQQVYVIRLD